MAVGALETPRAPRVDGGREELDDPKMRELLFPDYKKWLNEQ